MKKIVENFYQAFDKLDAEKMIECYHSEIVFEDPAFGELKGEKAKNMWRMLCKSQKGKDFKISYSNIKGDDRKGSANWEAFYTFNKSKKKIHNKISASFVFKDGLIIKHVDDFNLYKWAKQAMGITGFFIGNTQYFKKKLNSKTNLLLDKFEIIN